MSNPDIASLAQTIKGDVSTAESPGYLDAIARWAANASRKAKIVVFVKDSEDVIKSLHFARQHSLPIAVRGGGHSAAGASSIENGLVIDPSRYMNGVTVDEAKQLAYVGGGALWETVDHTAIKYGLATVGGTVNHTGVGGLILGGGYGWLSGSYGLAIDNLIQATIVTADGSVLTANDKENSDLFFAIRGGGGNFGVVTEFVLQLHPQRPTVYAGTLIYPPSAMQQLVAATKQWYQNISEKEAMIQGSSIGPDGNPIYFLIVFFNGSEVEGRANFKEFLDIGPLADMTKEIPYEELNALQNPMAAHGKGVYQKGLVQKRPYYEGIAMAHERFVEMAKSRNLQGAILYEYFPLLKINSVDGDKTAFRRDYASSILINISWDNSVEDRTEEARKHAYAIASCINGGEDLTSSESLGYANYDPDSILSDKAKAVFGDKYPRLQAIKKRHDPNNIFNKWFPIVPA